MLQWYPRLWVMEDESVNQNYEPHHAIKLKEFNYELKWESKARKKVTDE